MTKEIYLLLSFLLIFIITGCGNKEVGNGAESTLPQTDGQIEQSTEVVLEPEPDMEIKTLVVYFSATGTTKSLAEYAAEILNADLYEIVPKEPYTKVDLAYYTNGRADQEQNDSSARPEISSSVENIEEYDTIILAYPIWHGQVPRIINTFLESYDFSGKTIVPFCTSHSSNIGFSADNLHALCSDSVNWLKGKRFEAGTTKETLEEWLGNIDIK